MISPSVKLPSEFSSMSEKTVLAWAVASAVEGFAASFLRAAAFLKSLHSSQLTAGEMLQEQASPQLAGVGLRGRWRVLRPGPRPFLHGNGRVVAP